MATNGVYNSLIEYLLFVFSLRYLFLWGGEEVEDLILVICIHLAG